MQSTTQYTSARKELAPFVPLEARRILDVGCSTGAFGAHLKRIRDVEIWGVEPNLLAAKEAREKLDHVFPAPFSEELDIPSGYFDVVLFADVLEHLDNPWGALDLAKSKLANSGVVIASIPNVRYIGNIKTLLLDMDWKYQDAGILDRTHLRFFTRKSIVRMFEDAGYEVLSIIGVNPHYWSGKKIFLLRLFFGKWISDMKFLQYVVTARPLHSQQ